MLVFPGIFRGAIDARASRITNAMKLAASFAIADTVKNPSKDMIIPSPLSKDVAQAVADAVKKESKS